MKSRRTGLSLPKKRLPVRNIIIAISTISVLVAIFVYYTHEAVNDLPATQDTQVSSRKHEESVDSQLDAAKGVVPATQPVALTIATVGVHSAPIIPVGIDVNGEMDAPGTNHDVGWYDQSAKPIQDGGALLLDGHVGIYNQAAVFKHLHQLKTGELIEVTTQDGASYAYTVYHVEQLPLEDVDMRKMMHSVQPSKQGLNIITCAGEYDPARKTYDDRVLVYAVRSK